VVGGPVGDSELLLCHGMVCVVGRMRDLILQLSKSSIYSTKPRAGRPGAVLVSPTCVRLMNPTTIESATNVPEEFYEQRHSWFVGKFSVTSFVGMRTPNPPITTPIRFVRLSSLLLQPSSTVTRPC
ncbi:hypothetical protein KMY75_28875, partial [Klebsiella quasipneumoniae]|nr:hypothetical protein [Klebsiella quasipneumoniae]